MKKLEITVELKNATPFELKKVNELKKIVEYWNNSFEKYGKKQKFIDTWCNIIPRIQELINKIGHNPQFWINLGETWNCHDFMDYTIDKLNRIENKIYQY